jgi:hypothetical protein
MQKRFSSRSCPGSKHRAFDEPNDRLDPITPRKSVMGRRPLSNIIGRDSVLIPLGLDRYPFLDYI